MERRNNYQGRRGKQPERGKKTDYDRQRTKEQVQQIKKDLINFARSNWGKMWIESLLEAGRPFRMQRGIDYAKDDERIKNLSINKGQIFATVQGTAPTPYRVKIKFQTIPENEWKKIITHLRNKLRNLVSLLEGQLPTEIITIFEDNKYPLFPHTSRTELDATCSCPDEAIPCKHIASVILYIARIIDYDPFLLLELRGRTKEEIMSDLRLSEKTDDVLQVKKTKDIQFSFDVPKVSIQELNSEEMKKEDINKQISFQFKKPGRIIETLENLGLPPNLENPKAFTTVFDAIYKKIQREIFKLATRI